MQDDGMADEGNIVVLRGSSGSSSRFDGFVVFRMTRSTRSFGGCIKGKYLGSDT